MSIVCTLEPKVNLFKNSAAKNMLVLKNNNVTKSTAATSSSRAAVNAFKSYNNNNYMKDKNANKITDIYNNNNSSNNLNQQQLELLQQQYNKRNSVVELIARQQQLPHDTASSASTEALNSGNFVADMPEILSVAALNNNHHKSANNNSSSVAGLTTKTSTMHNVRLPSISPTLSLNGSSNDANNVHPYSMYGPISPQSSDSGHSLPDNISHVNGTKYRNSFSGSNSSFDSHNMSKSSQQSQSHKELFTQRKQREFTPDSKKDDSYWDRRRRNNEAAKRSREKRRYNDMVLEQRVVELTKENHVLKAQLDAIKDKFNISGENLVSVEQILASLPTSEQVLSITKRAKMTMNSGFNASTTGVPTSIVYGVPAHTSTNGSGCPPTSTSIAQNPSSSGILTPQKSNNLNQVSSNDPSNALNGDSSLICKTTQQSLQQSIKNVNHPNISPTLSHPHAMSSLAHMQLSTSPVHLNAEHYQPPPLPINNNYPHTEMSRPNNSNMLNNINPSANTTSHLENVRHMSTSEPPQQSPPSNLQNLHVLQALNRNVNCDDLDNLRKVVAVVGAAINTNVTTEPTEPPLYNAPITAPLYVPPHPTSIYAYSTKEQVSASSQNMESGFKAKSTEANHVSSSAVDAVSSSSVTNGNANSGSSVLNLSRRACSPAYEHILSSTSSSLSSASSSGVVSGDDEHEPDGTEDIEHNNVVNISTTSPSSTDSNNCLPLKLRHKSHLGDKDAAATALLALQHIKQEPVSNRASPPAWVDNGDNSSDERDSGISIGSTEWTSQFQRKVDTANCGSTSIVGVSPSEREHILKSHLARLESEVANIKNMMILSVDQISTPADLKI
ncbi:nuclear transcription factor Y subunit alpha isoform X1 [Anastrepha ludens]|uniref:nuclear transcription factor Y subunit alpha isoform X1 n=1 Tax=Anastrepha ludens TaxID=28586 RepID=UPI0023B016AD|nr:nuclear transcription factor Y subunit alpha isoform X1 [Anastrepha ludens]